MSCDPRTCPSRRCVLPTQPVVCKSKPHVKSCILSHRRSTLRVRLVSVLDLEQYRSTRSNRACSTGQIRCIPYSGASNDTDVSLSLRCQFLKARHPFPDHLAVHPSQDDQTFRRRLDDHVTHHVPLQGMVGRGGLEPPTSRLSGVRSNHLSYRPERAPRVLGFAHNTLVEPLELPMGNSSALKNDRRSQSPKGYGGAYRDRTDDLLNANQALSQLS